MNEFRQTHARKKDGLAAQLLGILDERAVYRVRWFENGKPHLNTLVRSEATFRDKFKVAA